MRFFRPTLALFIACTLLAGLSCLTPARAQDSKENADFKLALNLYNDGLFDLAAEQLRQFMSSYPNTAQGIEARFYLGLTQLKLKKYDDARLTFQTFALTYQDNPKAPDAWWNVGEAYAALKNAREAALAYERVKVFHPKSKLAAEALARASRYFSQAGDRENARRVLRIILQEYPSSTAVVAARTALGQMYYEEGNIDQAQSELRRVIDGDPSPDARAQALLILGNIYRTIRRDDQAAANYQEIIAKYKSSSAVQGAYVNFGRLLAGTGRYADAAANFRKALDEKSRSDSALVADALFSLGDAVEGTGDHAAAVSAYDRFIQSCPSDERVPMAIWKMAAAAARGRNFRASNDACTRLVRSQAPEPLRRRAMIKLAVNAAEQRNAALAAQLYQEYADGHPDDPAAADVLMRVAAIAERELHDPARAASAYEQVVARTPRSPLADDALAGAARCFEQMKEFDRARQLYGDLVRRFPASELRDTAAARITMIETFESKDKDAGLEKLALLVGDVVAEKDRTGLAYRLGEIYFNDLKNYAAAAAQYTSAINSGMNDARFVDALFHRAQAQEYLSWKDPSGRPRAIESYQTFLRSYPSEPRSEQAALSVFRLSATDLASAQAAEAQVLALFPRFSRRDAVLLRVAQLQEQAGNRADALESYRSLLADFPRSPEAEEAGYRVVMLTAESSAPDTTGAVAERYLAAYPSGRHAASVLARLGDLALADSAAGRAVEYYQRLVNEFSYTAAGTSARRRLADAYLAAGAPDQAIAMYAELLDAGSKDPLLEGNADPSLLLALGKAHQRAGNSAEAKRCLTEALAATPTGPVAAEACTVLGWIYRGEGALEIATSYFHQADRAAPGAAATSDVAGILFESGDYAGAASQYAQLAKSAPTDEERQAYEARVIVAHLRQDDLGRAEKEITAFTKAYKETDNDVAMFNLERGSHYFRKEEYDRALKIFSEVASKHDDSPSAPAAIYWAGKCLQAVRKDGDAVKEFERLINQYPESEMAPRAHLALGIIYYSGEKYGDAIKHFRLIVDDPNADRALLPYALSNLIETYETAGINDAALNLTRKYLELFPNAEDSFDKKIKIGILYGRLGYHDQAVLHLQSLLDQAGSDLEGEIRYYIAEANFNKGDYQQAILDFLKVPYLVTKKGKIDWTANSLYMSGQSYEKMGRYDQAITMYQQIVDRPGIDGTFKAAARKEIERVRTVVKSGK